MRPSIEQLFRALSFRLGRLSISGLARKWLPAERLLSFSFAGGRIRISHFLTPHLVLRRSFDARNL